MPTFLLSGTTPNESSAYGIFFSFCLFPDAPRVRKGGVGLFLAKNTSSSSAVDWTRRTTTWWGSFSSFHFAIRNAVVLLVLFVTFFCLHDIYSGFFFHAQLRCASISIVLCFCTQSITDLTELKTIYFNVNGPHRHRAGNYSQFFSRRNK